MITPADSNSAPAQYDAVPVQSMDIQAPQADLSGAVAAAGALAGAGVVYPQGPRQAATEALMQSPQGFASEGYDIDAGYSGGGGGDWPNDIEPTVQGP
jgi:hypothetical protein